MKSAAELLILLIAPALAWLAKIHVVAWLALSSIGTMVGVFGFGYAFIQWFAGRMNTADDSETKFTPTIRRWFYFLLACGIGFVAGAVVKARADGA